MLQWFKKLWGSTGGCISQDSVSRTPSPVEQSEGSKPAATASSACNKDSEVAAQPRPAALTSEHLADAFVAAPASGPHTPVQQQLTNHDRCTVHDQSRNDSKDASPAVLEAAVPSAKRYMYSGGKPVGIANTVTKYQEHRPVKPHLTPFEARVEAKMAEEQVVCAAVQGVSSNNSSGDDVAVKQQLIFDDASRLYGRVH